MLERRKMCDRRRTFRKTGLRAVEVENAGVTFFRHLQCDKRVFGWTGKGVGQSREVLLPCPPRP